MLCAWVGGRGEALPWLSAGSFQPVWSNGHSNTLDSRMLVLEASVPPPPCLEGKESRLEEQGHSSPRPGAQLPQHVG